MRHWLSPRGQELPPCNGCSGLPRLQAGVVCLINGNPLSTHTETRCPMWTVPRGALCSLVVQGSFLIISCFSPTNISHRLPISLPCSGEFLAISLSLWSFLPSSEILTMWVLICLMGLFFLFALLTETFPVTYFQFSGPFFCWVSNEENKDKRNLA